MADKGHANDGHGHGHGHGAQSHKGEMLLVAMIIFASIILAVGVGSGSAGHGTWHTAKVGNEYVFISPAGEQVVLKGISVGGLQSGVRETYGGAGSDLFQPPDGSSPGAVKQLIENVLTTFSETWEADIIRIPFCGSAYAQNYMVQDAAGNELFPYREWLNLVVQRTRGLGKVAILAQQTWAIREASYVDGFEDGCNTIRNESGVSSCAPNDWFIETTLDPTVCDAACKTCWECPVHHSDGCSLQSAILNKADIRQLWLDIAVNFKKDTGVWFELFHEPYERMQNGEPIVNDQWAEWTGLVHSLIKTIRTEALAKNIIIVTGLDWGYGYGPDHGPIHAPDVFLPWTEEENEKINIAYSFHPYQHGTCCGAIGAETDASATDPYQSSYCLYPPQQASNTSLPVGGLTCNSLGSPTQSRRLPPCTWIATARHPTSGQLGFCVGEEAFCFNKTQAECAAIDPASPQAGGWSRNVLPMKKFGPLIATEFGSMDCSTPYVRAFLNYSTNYGISYTASAWPRSSGSGTTGLGPCGIPSILYPLDTENGGDGSYKDCTEVATCEEALKPLPFSGQLIQQDMLKKVAKPTGGGGGHH